LSARAIFKTRITELFGIEHPVLCGGLMWLSDASYVAASVNAGGMGFITARTFPDPEAFRAELQKCLALTAGKPFGVNLYLTPREADNAFLKGHVRSCSTKVCDSSRHRDCRRKTCCPA
jgi:NADH:quinone reductase (non-electrogenic)